MVSLQKYGKIELIFIIIRTVEFFKISWNYIFFLQVLREKVFLPSTANLNPVEIRIRLAGENNSNMKYIQDETGATIFMRGIGSGFIEPSTGMESQEALHFYLE